MKCLRLFALSLCYQDFAYNQKVGNPLSGVPLPDEGDGMFARLPHAGPGLGEADKLVGVVAVVADVFDGVDEQGTDEEGVVVRSESPF
jgi:hypothetical protein